jgi:hypothetical protein
MANLLDAHAAVMRFIILLKLQKNLSVIVAGLGM